MDPIQNVSSQEENQSAATPVVLSQNRSNFLLILFVGLSMLLIGFMGGYFLMSKSTSMLAIPHERAEVSPTQSVTPTSTPTTTNTYTNSALGISFTYPTGWQAVDPFPSSPGSAAFIGFMPNGTDLKGSAPPIYIEHWDNPKNLSLQEFDAEYNAKTALATEFYSPDATISTIAGLTAYSKENTGCEPLLCTRVTVMAKNTIFIFLNLKEDTIFTPSQLAENKAVFNKILSSLTFSK